MTQKHPFALGHAVISSLAATAGSILLITVLLATLPFTRPFYFLFLGSTGMMLATTCVFSLLIAARRDFWQGREIEKDPYALAAGTVAGIVTGAGLLFVIPALYRIADPHFANYPPALTQAGLLVVALQFFVPVLAAKAIFRRLSASRTHP